MNRESHLEKTCRFIVEGKTEEKREQIYAALELLNLKGKMPSFSFRNPIFHWGFSAYGTRIGNTVVEDATDNTEIRQIPVMDYILSSMKVDKGRLVSRVKFSAIEEIVEKYSLDADAEEILLEIGSKRFSITTSGVSNFALFSTVRWETFPDGYCLFVCSDELASLYLFDSLVLYRTSDYIFKEIYKNIKIKGKMKIEMIITLMIFLNQI